MIVIVFMLLLLKVLSTDEELTMDRLSRVLIIMKRKNLAQQISEERSESIHPLVYTH